jgi:hypothetical protein
MYVRIARFESGDMDEIEAEAALMRDGIAAYRRGEAIRELPPRLAEVTRRVEMLVDRKKSEVVVSVYCATREDAHEADEILSGMSPRSKGWGERVSAGIYEVVLDESTGHGDPA